MHGALKFMTSVFMVMAWSATAHAFMEYPAMLKDKISQYPGSEIVQTTSMEASTQVILQSGDSMEKIGAFYLKELSANGLKIEMETKREQGWNVFFTHEDAGGMIGLMEQGPDKVIVTIVYGSN